MELNIADNSANVLEGGFYEATLKSSRQVLSVADEFSPWMYSVRLDFSLQRYTFNREQSSVSTILRFYSYTVAPDGPIYLQGQTITLLNMRWGVCMKPQV